MILQWSTLNIGIEDQRRKTEYKINGVTRLTKYFLGDYEEETDNLGNTKKIHYFSSGEILINTNGVETLYYGYSDYQGNLVAFANEAGTVVENGRFVYNSLTAQFLSPDPFVQSPENWLNYYRYSYCLNNPVIYTDPSGYLSNSNGDKYGGSRSAWQIFRDGGNYQDAIGGNYDGEWNWIRGGGR